MQKSNIPIVAILGSVDHGKSSLLDSIRKTNTVDNEAGEITQHIGAHMVEKNKRLVTFIDTPGHASFQMTRDISLVACDVAVLLISCDDGWKEQTSAVYKCIKEKEIPFIVVFSKCDVENANIEKLKKEVMQNNILLDGLGGNVPWLQVSSKTNHGIDELIDLILLFYDMLEKKESDVDGVIIDTDIDEKAGIAATIIMKDGILKSGDFVVSGDSFAPTRIMLSCDLTPIKEAGQSVPVRVVGFSKPPTPGEKIKVFKKKKEVEKYLKNNISNTVKTENTDQDELENSEKTKIIIKADTSGTLLANQQEISKHKNFIVISTGLGGITQKDLDLAKLTGNTHIIGFNVKTPKDVLSCAKTNNIIIKEIETVYQIDDWIKDMQKKKGVVDEDDISGTGEIIKIFKKKAGVLVCGVKITLGKFAHGEKCILKRKNKIIHSFTIQSMEQDNKEEKNVSGVGVCFAMSVKTDIDFLVGDIIISCNN